MRSIDVIKAIFLIVQSLQHYLLYVEGSPFLMDHVISDFSRDIEPAKAHSESTRTKRYVLSKEKWAKKTLRWKLHSNRLSPADMFIIRVTLHRAFDLWASSSALQFIEVTSKEDHSADIDIVFLKGKHGDGLPFDGPQGVVAHAFYPPVGALHFDADENWTLNRRDGINLYQTAVHEIGHLLGLEHSSDFRAVMYPRNRKFETDYQLADDDVRAIRRLYS